MSLSAAFRTLCSAVPKQAAAAASPLAGAAVPAAGGFGAIVPARGLAGGRAVLLAPYSHVTVSYGIEQHRQRLSMGSAGASGARLFSTAGDDNVDQAGGKTAGDAGSDASNAIENSDRSSSSGGYGDEAVAEADTADATPRPDVKSQEPTKSDAAEAEKFLQSRTLKSGLDVAAAEAAEDSLLFPGAAPAQRFTSFTKSSSQSATAGSADGEGDYDGDGDGGADFANLNAAASADATPFESAFGSNDRSTAQWAQRSSSDMRDNMRQDANMRGGLVNSAQWFQTPQFAKEKPVWEQPEESFILQSPFDGLPVVVINASFNNTKVFICKGNGQPVCSATAGTAGFKNKRKNSSYAGQVTGAAAAEKALALGIKDVRVKLKGVGQGRLAAVKGLQYAGLNVCFVEDATPIPHNGCRPRKIRRV